MEPNIISKTIQVEKSVWEKFKTFCKRAEIRRDPGKQAGIIIKDHLIDFDTMADTWKYLITELDYIIQNTQDLGKLDELCAKKETLKKALYRVGGSL